MLIYVVLAILGLWFRVSSVSCQMGREDNYNCNGVLTFHTWQAPENYFRITSFHNLEVSFPACLTIIRQQKSFVRSRSRRRSICTAKIAAVDTEKNKRTPISDIGFRAPAKQWRMFSLHRGFRPLKQPVAVLARHQERDPRRNKSRSDWGIERRLFSGKSTSVIALAT